MENKFNIKGKRGIIGSALTNFWSIIIFVIVVIIFFALFNTLTLKKIENKIISLDTQASKDITVINYLRTPIVTETGEEKMLADFIVETMKKSFDIGKGKRDDAMWKKFDEIIKMNLLSKIDSVPRPRLMILTEGNTVCWYDSRGTCNYKNPIKPNPPIDRGVLLPNPGFDFDIEVTLHYS